MIIDEIINTIEAGVPGIHILGKDNERIDEYIVSVAKKLNWQVIEWNQGYGWVNFNSKQSINEYAELDLFNNLEFIRDNNPSQKCYVIRDLTLIWQNDFRAVTRIKQELLRIKKHFNSKSVLIFVSEDKLDIPMISELYVRFACLPFSRSEADNEISQFIDSYSIRINTETRNRLIAICAGMERDMVIRILRMLYNTFNQDFNEKALILAIELKKQTFAQNGLLELIDVKLEIDCIGGLENLKVWLKKKARIVQDIGKAEEFGIQSPKGVFLVGVPGCGKSMTAQASAALFNIPLLRLDIGTMMGKYVGESEANMKRALEIAEKASPCVLWIDEFEKAFAGTSGQGGAAEVTTRLFGNFLTWMQEKPGTVFVVATANDLSSIPAEMLRRGRFDEIFYIDLPLEYERKQIFEVLLKNLPMEHKIQDLDVLARKTDGYSGADINALINEALEDAFRKKSNLSYDLIEENIKNITPINVVLKDKVKEYQSLFKQFKLKSASSVEREVKDLSELSKSTDPVIRQGVAGNKSASQDILKQLVEDKDSNVIVELLKNPSCPPEALTRILYDYCKNHFRERSLSSSYWLTRSGSEKKVESNYDILKNKKRLNTIIAEQDFKLAIKHPNLDANDLLFLYDHFYVSDERFLLGIINKLSRDQISKLFYIQEVIMPASIDIGAVRNMIIKSGELVDNKKVLLEVDDNNGRSIRLASPVDSVIGKIFAKEGELYAAGDKLFSIFITKKKDISSFKDNNKEPPFILSASIIGYS